MFELLSEMDMRQAAYSHDMSSEEALASASYLGYVNDCENRRLLDAVVQVALAYPSEEIDLEHACRLANVDFYSLSQNEIQYIIKQFEYESER